MILSIGQVLGALALLVGAYLLWGLAVVVFGGGLALLVVCTLVEFAGTPRAPRARADTSGGA